MILRDAVASVEEVERNICERPMEVGKLRVEAGRLMAGDGAFTLEGAGFERFCKPLHAPAQYLASIDKELCESVLQHQIERGDLAGKGLTIITRGDEFVAFGRSDLGQIRGTDVLQAIGDGVGESLDVHQFEINDDSFQIDLLASNDGEEVGPGDVVRSGLRVTHSLVFDHAIWIESYILRLVCSNGLTHRECVSRRAARTRRLPASHPGAAQLQIEQVRRLARSTWNGLRQKIDAIRNLRNEPADVESAVHRWLERARLSPKNLMPAIREAWKSEGGEATSFGVMNALTRVATHSTTLSSRVRRSLAGLAGLLAFRHQHLCPRCFSVLSGLASGPAETT